MIPATAMALALAGSFVAGIGYAFIYPALGREAVQAVSPERVGLALGYYSAFFDLSMGVSGLVLGQVADRIGLWAVFLAAILASALAALLVRTFPITGAVAVVERGAGGHVGIAETPGPTFSDRKR